MWMVASRNKDTPPYPGNHERWTGLGCGENTLAAVENYCGKVNNLLLPFKVVKGMRNYFRSADGNYDFMYLGILLDHESEPVTMTPPAFSLDELELAKAMIEGK